MKNSELLLINPPLLFKKGYRRPSISIPLGLLYLLASLKSKVKVGFFDFIAGIKTIDYRVFSRCLVATLAAWCLTFVLWYLLALSIDINISFLYIIMCSSVSTLVTLMPISISGIGTRDMVLIFLFSQIGLSQESAIALSISVLIIKLIESVGGLIAWYKKPFIV